MKKTLQLKDVNASVTSIRLVITHKGKVYRKNIGISVEPKKWKNYRTGDRDKDMRIRNIINGLDSVLDEHSEERHIIVALARIENGMWYECQDLARKVTFDEYFRQWYEKNHNRQYKLTYNVITRLMGKGGDWEDIDNSFHMRLIAKLKDEGYATNTIGDFVSRLKTVMSEGMQLKYHHNMDYLGWKRFHIPSFAIALTLEEMSLLESVELSEEYLRRVRDMAILGYYTGARFSDYSRLSLDNIIDEKVVFVQEKTDRRVVIPCSPKIVAVLERYGGRAPKGVQQKFNKYIKEVCRLAGINSVVQVPEYMRNIKGWSKSKKVEKWELVSSHTFRRSILTQLSKDGVPLDAIRSVSGHTKLSTLQTYLKTTKEEYADILSDNPIFK